MWMVLHLLRVQKPERELVYVLLLCQCLHGSKGGFGVTYSAILPTSHQYLFLFSQIYFQINYYALLFLSVCIFPNVNVFEILVFLASLLSYFFSYLPMSLLNTYTCTHTHTNMNTCVLSCGSDHLPQKKLLFAFLFNFI